MKKDLNIFLNDILEAIKLIETYLENKTKKDFLESIQLQDSVIRRLEIIGEAVKSIPIKIRESYPKILWKDFAGLRDVLIHRYAEIDLILTWETIKKDLPQLRDLIIKIKKELESKS